MKHSTTVTAVSGADDGCLLVTLDLHRTAKRRTHGIPALLAPVGTLENVSPWYVWGHENGRLEASRSISHESSAVKPGIKH